MAFEKITKKFVRRLAIKIGVLLHEVNNKVARETLPEFGNTPRNVKIDLPRRIINPDRIFLGDQVWLGPGAFINAITRYPSASMQHPDRSGPTQEFEPKIIIGNRVVSNANLQVAAHAEIVIEDDVILATNVHMTDGFHGYEHANEPYKYQPIFRIAPIVIKRGCWIGQNAVIMPGVTIGELSIIGANSVVTESIPARCIAVGSPARVIKKWDDAAQQWVPAAKTEAPELSEAVGSNSVPDRQNLAEELHRP